MKYHSNALMVMLDQYACECTRAEWVRVLASQTCPVPAWAALQEALYTFRMLSVELRAFFPFMSRADVPMHAALVCT
jgi:hypothetical protein